jgi:hypothetical protein
VPLCAVTQPDATRSEHFCAAEFGDDGSSTHIAESYFTLEEPSAASPDENANA